MKRTYQVVTKPSTLSSRELAEFLSKDGQLLLPLVELLERGEKAIDEVIDVMGRATVEAVLRMSAEQLAGPKRQGRRADDRALYWHGSQPGRVTLSERQLRVEKPRLRKKTERQGDRPTSGEKMNSRVSCGALVALAGVPADDAAHRRVRLEPAFRSSSPSSATLKTKSLSVSRTGAECPTLPTSVFRRSASAEQSDLRPSACRQAAAARAGVGRVAE